MIVCWHKKMKMMKVYMKVNLYLRVRLVSEVIVVKMKDVLVVTNILEMVSVPVFEDLFATLMVIVFHHQPAIFFLELHL